MNFGRSTVDLIGKDKISKDGTLFGGEFSGFLVIDQRPGNIGGKEIGGKLDPTEGGIGDLGESADDQGLCQAGNTFDKDVSAGQYPDEEFADNSILTDHDPGDRCADIIEYPRTFEYLSVYFLYLHVNDLFVSKSYCLMHMKHSFKRESGTEDLTTIPDQNSYI